MSECLCVSVGVMDGSSISRCLSPCPEQIDGCEDHAPFAHKALPLGCPLISMRAMESQINGFILGNE